MSLINITHRKAVDHQLDNNQLSDILTRVYANRGISQMNELDYSLKNLISPSVLPNIDIVCAKLFQWIKDNKTICIVGDYDVDGATATTLLLKFFQHCQLDCQYFIPDRFTYGYGLSEKIVGELAQKNVDAIITVDNGISSVAGVDLANELGIDVIVTDHHIPPEIIPDTPYIINPSLETKSLENKNSEHKDEDNNSDKDKNSQDLNDLKSLAGVGVVFYVLMEFRAYLRKQNWFVENNLTEPNLAEYLDLVALGTVADIVPLGFTNRILVSQGLKRMRAKASCYGINALFHIAQRDSAKAHSDDLGYAIAPRLNAAGRLSDMSLGVKCLMAKTIFEAEEIATELNEINQERKSIQAEMQEEAFININELSNSLSEQQNTSHSLIVYQPHWHQGITGLIAGKVKESFHLPVVAFANESDEFVFTDANNGMKNTNNQNDGSHDDSNDSLVKLKGSARSIDKVHIKDVLNLVMESSPNLLIAFGGHAMAAGMSIYERDLDEFKSAFNKALQHYCKQHDVPINQLNTQQLLTDGELSSQEITLDNISLLEQAGPWGSCFEAPVFDNTVIVKSARLLKDKHMKLTLSFIDNNSSPTNATFDAIYFNYTDKFGTQTIQTNDQLNIVYSLSINSYRGQETVQLMLKHINFD